MRGKMIGLTVVATLLSLSLVSLGSAQNTPKFSDSIEVKSTICYPLEFSFKRPETQKTNFARVSFSHGDHGAVACQTCHHTWDGKGQIESCSTKGCHDAMKDRHDKMGYFQAFHNRDSVSSCLGCHAKHNAELKEKGKPQLQLAACANNICHKPAK